MFKEQKTRQKKRKENKTRSEGVFGKVRSIKCHTRMQNKKKEVLTIDIIMNGMRSGLYEVHSLFCDR